MSAALSPTAGSEDVHTNRALGWFKRSLARYTIQYLLLIAVIAIFLTNENSRQVNNVLSRAVHSDGMVDLTVFPLVLEPAP